MDQMSKALLMDNQKVPSSGCCPAAKLTKRKRATELAELEPVLTYEEVGLYATEENWKRPVVIVGADELRPTKICEIISTSDPHKYIMPRRIFSEKKKSKDTREATLSDVELAEKIKTGEVIDYKTDESSGRYYEALLREDIIKLSTSCQTCICTCQLKHLSKIRSKELKPVIIYIAAPNIERLKTLLDTTSALMEECKHIIDLSRHNESMYAHLFDYVLTLTDWKTTANDILNLLEEHSSKQQYVPAEWLSTTTAIKNTSKEYENLIKEIHSYTSTIPTVHDTASPKHTETKHKERSNSFSNDSFTPSPRLKRLADEKKSLTPNSLRKVIARASPKLAMKHSESRSKLSNKSYNSSDDELG